jgi:uncharacterized protein
MTMKQTLWIALVALLAVASAGADGTDALLDRLSRPDRFVNDYANVFSREQREALESCVQEGREKTTAEIAVVARQSLEGGEIADFANRLFEKWGIGRKDKDNGILLIAALQDRAVRIEVGYGLESVMTDSHNGVILDSYVIPHFRDERYAEGLEAGAKAIGAVLAREHEVVLSSPMPEEIASIMTSTGAVFQAEAPQELTVEGFIFAVLLLVFLMSALIWAAKRGHLRGTTVGSGGGPTGGFGGGSSSGGFGGGSSGGGGASRRW